MKVRIQGSRVCVLGTIVVLAAQCCALSALAQTVSEDEVKAAYLYNFAKFVEWPERNFANPSSPILLCVLSDQSFEAQLKRIVTGKNIAGHPVSVIPLQNAEDSRRCHVLFINSSRSRQLHDIVELLRGSSVLTVGEADRFVQDGGMINFVLQDDHVQFEVNHRAANAAGLHISARLLSLAKAVVE